jgi:1-aminocyclopropane-1-carboxylate deaminase/D-cysteine desulfhydrase-like pyridoxal-dependent ACC family enzyme
MFRFGRDIMLNYQPTPIVQFKESRIQELGINVLIKREDLNHPFISGNKWWKLKYNLDEAIRQKKNSILTFGGAYSNHIFAVAAAAKECGLKSIGIIRGEETLPLNGTLTFAKENGMELHYISRQEYGNKNNPDFIEKLHYRFGDFYLIPEGGTNSLAIKGCAEFAEQELSKIEFDHVLLPVGTGGTIAGLICGLPSEKNIMGISVLKDGEFLRQEIEKLILSYNSKNYANWSVLTSYHHGGYAKVTPGLLMFIKEMKEKHSLPLDPVYTGKLLWAVSKEIERGTFKEGSTVLVIHTGGLQGATN